jgi:hypothetical protein
MEEVAWLVLGMVIVVAAAGAEHSARARRVGRMAFAPHHTLLVAVELTVGLLALSGGRRVQVALAAAMAMHIALPVFGWILTVWSLVMLPALALLLRAEHRAMDRPQTAAKSSTPAPVG